MKYLFSAFMILGILAPSLSFAGCFDKIDELMRVRLKETMRMNDPAVASSGGQHINFNSINFSPEEKEIILKSVRGVNEVIQGSTLLKLPKEISTSCGIGVDNGCLHFHHLFFNVDTLVKDGAFTQMERAAIIQHEYAHALYHRYIYEKSPQTLKYFEFFAEFENYKLLAKKAESERETSVFLSKANDARIAQLELEETGTTLWTLHSSLSELFADSMAVLIGKDPRIMSNVVTKVYLDQVRNISSPDQFTNAIKNKIKFRSFNDLSPKTHEAITVDVHDIFGPSRREIGQFFKLENMNLSREKKRYITETILKASEQTMLVFETTRKDNYAHFIAIYTKLIRGGQLDTGEHISYLSLLKSFNDVFIERFHSIVDDSTSF